MAASDPANVAVGYLAQQPTPALSPADEAMRRKTFTQTIEDARKTMFDLSQTARPAVILPPGKQSVFHALVKARQDVDVTLQRRATSQGVHNPAVNHDHSAAATADTHVNPTSYVVPTNPTRVAPPAELQGVQAADDARASMNKRGLLGYFFKPKSPAAAAE
jgi:hypothetical protein